MNNSINSQFIFTEFGCVAEETNQIQNLNLQYRYILIQNNIYIFFSPDNFSIIVNKS